MRAAAILFVAWTLAFPMALAQSPPQILRVAPEGVVAETQPTIRATFQDDEGVIANATVLTLDGARLNLTVSTSNEAIARPPTPLQEGSHRASISVRDGGGRITTRDWTFQVLAPAREARIFDVSLVGGVVREMPTVNVRFEGSALHATIDDGPVPVTHRGSEAAIATVPLEDGPHVLNLTAEGANGTKAERSISFVVDTTAPLVAFVDTSELPSAITVSWFDENGIRPASHRALLDNATIPTPLAADGGRLQLPPVGIGNHSLVVEVFDVAGNLGRAAHEYVVTGITPEGHTLRPGPEALPTGAEGAGTPVPVWLALLAVVLGALILQRV